MTPPRRRPAGGAAAFARFHPGEARALSRATLVVPTALTGMGTLLWLEVERPDGVVEHWDFRTPAPRVAFAVVTPIASRGAPRAGLWLVGGCYRVDARGFRNTGGRSPLRRQRVAHARTVPAQRAAVARYRATHGALDPHEAFRGAVRLSPRLFHAGRLYAIAYRTDKAEDPTPGAIPYRHGYEDHARPAVTVTEDGAQIVLVGGHYTVTPHGIEDLPA